MLGPTSSTVTGLLQSIQPSAVHIWVRKCGKGAQGVHVTLREVLSLGSFFLFCLMYPLLQLTCMSSRLAQCLMARSLSRRFSCHTAAASFQVAKACDTATLLHTWTSAFMRACRQGCQLDS